MHVYHKTWCICSLHQGAALDCYPDIFDQGQVFVTKIEIQFPLYSFSLHWPIDTKLGVWVAFINMQFGLLPGCL